MKKLYYSFITFLLFFINSSSTAHVAQDQGRFSPAAVIYQLFEMMRGIIKNGDATKDIPVLDPCFINAREINLFGFMYSGQVNISNGILKGVGDFRLEEFDFFKNEIALTVKITFPVIELRADYYEMKGSILEIIPLAGTGLMDIEVKEFILFSKIYMKQSADGKSVLLDRLEGTHFLIANISSRTEFDKNFDDIMNAWIEDLLGEYLTRFSKYISSFYGAYLVDSLNPILNEYETWSILATIL